MDVIKALKIEYNEENIATSMSVDMAISGLKGTFSAEMEKADRGERLVIKINGEEYSVYGEVKCEPTARRERFYEAIANEISEMLEDLNIHEEIPMSLEQYAEWYGDDELELPQAKYIQYEDMRNVGDSMMLNEQTLIAELIAPDGHKAELEVRGEVRVTTHDENGEIIAVYRSFSEMPEELKEKVRDGSYLDDESIYVGDSNWFELFYRGDLAECVDVEHKSPEQIYELMAEWVNDFEKEYDREYNLVPEKLTDEIKNIQFENKDHFLDDAEKMYLFKKYNENALTYSEVFGSVTKAQYDATAREVATEIANFYEEFTDEPDKPTVEQILSEMKEHGVPQTLNNYAEDILDWRNAFKDELSAEEIQASKDVVKFITNETAFTLHEKLTDKFDSMSFDSETQGIATIITPTGKEAYLDVRGEMNISVLDAEGEILAEYKNFSEMPKDLQEKIADGSYLHDDSICVNNNNWFEFFYYDGDKLLANEVVDFKKGTPEEVYKQMASIINNVEPLAVPETINEAEGVNTTLIYEQPVNYFALTATERTKKTAEEFGITDKLEALTSDLMQIKGVVNVEYDLDGFWDDMKHVIFLPKYDIPVEAENYFEQRSEMLKNVLETAKKHGLTRTEDSIEDYGEHFYIVTRHDKSWLAKEDKPKEKPKKKTEIERD